MNIFQQAKAKVPTIDNRKVKAELLYNQLNLFFWCRLAYLILGGILLFIACGEIIADFKWGRKLSGILIALLTIAFLTHTAGNHSFGSGTPVLLANVSCRYYHDRLCILCALRTDRTI